MGGLERRADGGTSREPGRRRLSPMPTVITESQRANRIALVEEHVRAERDHDVEATLNTVGANPHFRINDAPLDDREAVAGFYQGMFEGFPDIEIDVTNRFVTDEAIILEVVLRGTHNGTWAGIPPSGRRMEVPGCAVYTFDGDEKIEEERAYFDVNVILKQIGAA